VPRPIDGRVDEHGHLTTAGRREDIIALSSGKNIYLEEVEAHYQRSPFIREVCVLGVGAPDASFPERLHAIVVPDVDVLRERRIVNTTELIRYELENLSQSLSADTRVTGFDVAFEPLPRTTTGNLKRHEILKHYQSKSRPVEPPAVSEVEPHLQRLVATIQSIMRPGVVVRADSSLEHDLGLDSMDRVELLATLERRFGVELPEHVALSAFRVRDLADAFRETREQREGVADPSWASLLERIEPTPALHALLERRPLSALALFAIARIIVRVLLRPHVEGVERLPRQGPFIISPNHQSYLDPIVIVTVLPLRVYRELFFVGAAEYFQSPLMRRLAAWLNVIPVDPDAYLMPAMQAGAFGLRHGKVLMLFPEGERSIDGAVKKFRKGAAILSRQHRVPIVPAAIDGMFEIWPRTRPLNWRKLLPWSSHRTRIAFGDPLSPSDAVAEQTARLHDAVERMWRGFEPSDRG
jgi:long-chain acyl-CoA synthetase